MIVSVWTTGEALQRLDSHSQKWEALLLPLRCRRATTMSIRFSSTTMGNIRQLSGATLGLCLRLQTIKALPALCQQ